MSKEQVQAVKEIRPIPHSTGTLRFSSMRALVVISVALPLFLFALFATFRHAEAMKHAEEGVARSLRVATEHAAKVMAGAESMQDRTLDMVDGKSAAELRADEARLHQALSRFIAGQKQIQSIWIIGSYAKPIATTVAYPAPKIDVQDRAYFAAHRAGFQGRYLSEPLITKVSKERIVDVSVRFAGPDGGFGGIVNISVRASYFEEFFANLLSENPGLAMLMFRQDGAIFVRSPRVPGMAEKLGEKSSVLARVRAGQDSGQFRAKSSVDGEDRLQAFDKVGGYPLFLAAGVSVAAARWALAKELAASLLLGLPPFAALIVAARFAARRAREAMETAGRLEAETATRLRAEQALLQAQKLEAMGRLTGGVAHDFNNALMVISNSAFLLQRTVPESGRKPLDAIGRAVDSATKLTRQLLSFSRRQALLPELVNLHERLPAVKDLVGPVLGRQIELIVEVEPDAAPVKLDPAELELALLNLSINARDAMPDGGRLTISALGATVDIPARMSGPAVVLEVSDTGCGIAPENIEKVFEPFFTTKPVGHGTGLGLSQVYGFCERAGGAVAISSAVGVGTTVRMFFPAASGAADVEAGRAKPVERRLGRSVLLVEDNGEVADAILPVLEALGCEAHRVESAAAALEWLAARPQVLDLVLSDVTMPGDMDGIGLAAKLRETTPGLPVLLMTGYAERIEAAARLGFDVLPKPCSAEALSDAIGRLARPRSSEAPGAPAAVAAN